MILLDSDVLLIAHRYQNDPRFPVNDQTLQVIRTDGVPLGITSQALLEIVGILSFNVPVGSVPRLPHFLVGFYGFAVFPDLQHARDYAGCSIGELIVQMVQRMSGQQVRLPVTWLIQPEYLAYHRAEVLQGHLPASQKRC